MAKVLVFLCVVLLAMTLVMACKPPGMWCTGAEDCCPGFECNPFACRCVKVKEPTGSTKAPPSWDCKDLALLWRALPAAGQ